MRVAGLHDIPRSAITIAEIRSIISDWRAAGCLKVAFVPTMGALHSGHLRIVEEARKLADKTVVSIFVNPKQFGPSEDFARYPRPLKSDLEKLVQAKADAVFVPNAAEMYPEGFQTVVDNPALSHELCGRSRPGHFSGMLTIVLKLLNIVQPDHALFGKKDYQQLRLIERMVSDLHLKVEIVGLETVRETDGLAMSSRNQYLSEEDRRLAPQIYQGLQRAREQGSSGEKSTERLVATFISHLQGSPQLASGVEYVEIRRRKDLKPVGIELTDTAVMLAAVRLGGTRLIDNIEIGE